MKLNSAEDREAWLTRYHAMVFYFPDDFTIYLRGAYVSAPTVEEAIRKMHDRMMIVDSLVSDQQKLLGEQQVG